jgi:N-acetylglucosamine kinase-like BadF-type ATPase
VDHLYTPAGRAQTYTALRQAIGEALGAARAGVPLRSAVAGLTGLEPDTPEARAAARLVRRIARAAVLRVTGDVEVAFTGAGAGGPGVMVIAGTGSVAVGRNAQGHMARSGGYGFLIDDVGGGVGIGRAALQAALRAYDGRGPRTRLLALLLAHLGEWPAIRRRVYGEGGRAAVASLVPLVAQAARGGDAVARRILADAGRALAELALAVARSLEMTRTRFSLYPVGGVFAVGRQIREPFRAALRAQVPHCRIRAPIFPPVIGAVLLAMQGAGLPVTPAVRRRLARGASADILQPPF